MRVQLLSEGNLALQLWTNFNVGIPLAFRISTLDLKTLKEPFRERVCSFRPPYSPSFVGDSMIVCSSIPTIQAGELSDTRTAVQTIDMEIEGRRRGSGGSGNAKGGCFII